MDRDGNDIEQPEVQIGQVWIDCDRRARGRRLRVKGLGYGLAVVECLETGRRSRIKLARFRERSNGYRLAGPLRDTDLLEPVRDRGEW